MDLSTLTDEELNDSLNEILAEQERRKRLANIPNQIAELAKRYADDGGDPTVVQDAATVRKEEPAP